MNDTIFNTLKNMCWTLYDKVIILYNPYTIPIFLLNKSIKDFFENLDEIILIFVEVVTGKTKANVEVLLCQMFCVKVTTNT